MDTLVIKLRHIFFLHNLMIPIISTRSMMHTTYINIASIDFFLILLYEVKIFPLFAVFHYSSLYQHFFFSYVDINSTEVSGQKRPGDKKTISILIHAFVSLKMPSCWCVTLTSYIAKRVVIPLVWYLCGCVMH